MPDIRFGEIDFSGDGAYIWGAGQYSAPARSVDFIEVPGRNGDLLIDNGNYTNTKAVFDVVITKDVKENTDRLKHLLYSQKGYQRLYDSDLKGFYRMASFNRGFEIPSTDGGIVRIEFDCKPFKYDIVGEEIITVEGNTVNFYLDNPYFEDARPLFKVYTDVTSENDYCYIDVNGKTISFPVNGMNGLIIDTSLQYAYRDLGPNGLQNCNNVINTTDVSLHYGQNELSFYGGIRSVEIVPRWVTL